MKTIPKTAVEARAFLDKVDSELSLRENARNLDMPYTTFVRWKNKSDYLVEGYDVKGESVLMDNEGNVKLRWVKANKDLDKARDYLENMALGFASEIKASLPVAAPKYTEKDLCSCYVLTDFHLGQLSWKPEAGDDWDLKKAENVLIDWFGRAIQRSEPSHTAVLAQLGDFLHWDGLLAVTPTSGHVLDADTRFPKLAETAVRVLRAVIDMLLQKHQHVHIICAEGNHDLASSVWLRIMMNVLYENEPRVTVDLTPIPYYCFEWGSTSLFFHHGHIKKLEVLSKAFAGIYRDVFGRTKYSYGHTGHLHHNKSTEDSLMRVMQHPTLTPKDAHSARGAYNSQRGANVVTYSKHSGQISMYELRPYAL